jgi:hypothetical protein
MVSMGRLHVRPMRVMAAWGGQTRILTLIFFWYSSPFGKKQYRGHVADLPISHWTACCSGGSQEGAQKEDSRSGKPCFKLGVSCACWGVKVLMREPRRDPHLDNRLWSQWTVSLTSARCGLRRYLVGDAGHLAMRIVFKSLACVDAVALCYESSMGSCYIEYRQENVVNGLSWHLQLSKWWKKSAVDLWPKSLRSSLTTDISICSNFGWS